MIEIILWYLISLLVGWLVFPLAYRLLSRLPDRGLAFLRPLGLLAWGFVFWLLSSFGILSNSVGEMLLVLALVAMLSIWAGHGRWGEMRTWLRSKMRLVLTIEVLFLVSMIFMAIMRAASPDVTGTEKPMELAFINAILRSPNMPPADPWLAGYAISYYYFGYLMVAMLASVSGVAGGVAFNLAIALWFAMTAVGAYGILYNLLSRSHPEGEQKPSRFGGANAWALLAPLFILVMSNMGGLMEILHANGTFWGPDETGQLSSPFWQNLKIQEWDQPPAEPFELSINRSGWWWWRSSRVLQDFRLNGQAVEVIDEFPQFSYILADLHPHVLAVPFVLLVLGLIFNFYLTRSGEASGSNIKESSGFNLQNWARTPEFWASAVIVGALGFLNIWDFPIYLVVFGMAFVLVRYSQNGWKLFGLLGDFFGIVLALGLAGVLAYLPFYLGFSSQAGPPYFYLSLAFFTPGANFWIMFATLLIPLFAWLLWIGVKTNIFARKNQRLLWQGLVFAAILVFGLWLLSYLIGLVLAAILSAAPEMSVSGQQVGDWFYAQQGSTDGFAILGQSFLNRLAHPGTWLTLLVLLALIWAGLGAFRRRLALASGTESIAREDLEATNPAAGFVLVLALAGAGLTLFPEFFFLKDDFGARMNTIFKFYYQAWILWGIAAAFGTVMLLTYLRRAWKLAYGLVAVLLVSAGMIYAYFGFVDRMGLRDSDMQNDFKLWGLDGAAYVKNYTPSEWEAIQFLHHAQDGVVLEAVGGQYSQYARVATLTGLPTVLGWPGHEGQWRGTRVNFYPRIDQVKLVYETSDWETAKAILEMYDVRYIYIGALERTTYLVREEKFVGKVAPVFSNDSVIIYEYVP